MAVKRIQDLFANALKIQLGRGARKSHLYTKPHTKRDDALYMPHGQRGEDNLRIKERIMCLAKEKRIILDLEDVVEQITFPPKQGSFCSLQFGNLEPVILFKPWLFSPDMKQRSFSAPFLDRTTFNMTSCSELEEEIDEEVPARRVV